MCWVNFLHSGWYRAVFRICAERRVDNRKKFLLLLIRAYIKFSFSFHTATLMRWLRGDGRFGGEAARAGDPNWPKGVPDNLTSCSVDKAERKKKESRGHLEWWHLCSQVNISHNEALPSWRWLNTCLPMWSRELIPCSVLLTCMTFAFPIKLSSCQLTNFPAFMPSILSRTLLVGEWVSAWYLVGVKTQNQEKLPEGQEVKFRNLQILVSTVA